MATYCETIRGRNIWITVEPVCIPLPDGGGFYPSKFVTRFCPDNEQTTHGLLPVMGQHLKDTAGGWRLFDTEDEALTAATAHVNGLLQ